MPKTWIDWIIAAAEEQIRLLKSARREDPKAVRGNPANYRAAIRMLRRAIGPFVRAGADAETAAVFDPRNQVQLRKALTPFARGWVDSKTGRIADWPAIVKALSETNGADIGRIADWPAIDRALITRDAELAVFKRPPPYELREVDYNCQRIATATVMYGQLAGVVLQPRLVSRFVHTAIAIGFTGIEEIRLPDPIAHGDRLRRRMLGPPRRAV